MTQTIEVPILAYMAQTESSGLLINQIGLPFVLKTIWKYYLSYFSYEISEF